MNKPNRLTIHSTARRTPMLTAAIAAVTLAMGAASLTIAASAEEDAAERSAHHNTHHNKGPVNLAQLSEKNAARFATMDTDSDGRVTEEEFFASPTSDHRAKHFGNKHKRKMAKHKKARRMRTDNPEQNAEIFAALDTDGNGQLSADEFNARRDVVKAMKRTRVKEKAFARLDANGDGHLDAAELNQRVERLQALDTNGDGELDRKEMRAGRDARRNSKRDTQRNSDRS